MAKCCKKNHQYRFLDASPNFGKAVDLGKVCYVCNIKMVSRFLEVILTGTYFVSFSHAENLQKKTRHNTVENYLEIRSQVYTKIKYRGRYFNDPQLATRRFLGGI
jgi:Ethanolamine utilization protein EutJ (predicted chaperonin)